MLKSGDVMKLCDKVSRHEQEDCQHIANQDWQPMSKEKCNELVKRYPPCDGFTEAYYSRDYKVLIYHHEGPSANMWRMAIYSRKNKPISSWVVLQSIKNHFWGEETLAVEIFPPQRFVINEAHTRHLWRTDHLLDVVRNFPRGMIKCVSLFPNKI
jgi:hypothetical protein